jgi:hypothetical protein
MKENDFGIFGLDNSNMDLLWTNTLKIFKNPTKISCYLPQERFLPLQRTIQPLHMPLPIINLTFHWHVEHLTM